MRNAAKMKGMPLLGRLRSSRRVRTVLRWTIRGMGVLIVLTVIILAMVMRTALFERLSLFPRQAEAWKAIQAARQDVTFDDGWNEYRGVLHSHSELSHDSAMTRPEIVKALKKADVDVIALTDHYADGRADYALGSHGLFDGILFIQGYELDRGLMPWGVTQDTVFQFADDPREIARRVREMGAVLFYSHCEQERDWDLPELDGMEIYNTHADLMDEDLKSVLPTILLSLKAFPDQAMHKIFDTPEKLLARWDDLNRTRHITGIAANDTHQNVGIQGIFTPKNTLILKGTGEKTEIMSEKKLNVFTRLLLRVVCGRLTPGQEAFRIELDPYDRMCHYVNTHLLARDLAEEEIVASLKAGRAFVGFDVLADSTGFIFLAQGSERTVVMGERIPLEPGLRLRAMAPCECQFSLIKDGKRISQSEGREFSWDVKAPGKYRIEANLNILGKPTTWVLTNPIEVSP